MNHFFKKQFSKHFLLLLIVVFLFSCNSKKSNIDKQTDTDEGSFLIKDTLNNEFYLFPSPTEVLSYINEANLKYIPNLVNNVNNFPKYLTLPDKSLNIGVYIADLMYLSFFKTDENSFKLIETIKKLIEEIKIDEALPINIFENISRNINNPDTLINISANMFSKIYNYLISQNRKNTFSAITIGGYIECYYLGIMMIDTFNINNILIKKLAEQKIVFENLYEYIKNTDNLEFLVDLNQYLIEIKDLFSKFNENMNVKPIKKPKEKIEFKTEYSYVINENDFYKFKKAIINTRNKITMN